METKNTLKVTPVLTEKFTAKERLLINFRSQVLKFGFSKVRMDEISESQGISKKTIYKYFPTKKDMLKLASRFFMKIFEKKINSILNSDKHFVDKISDFLLLVGEQLSMATQDGLRDIQKYCPDIYEEMETFRREKILIKLENLFIQAKKERVFREDINERVMVLMLINSVEGIANPNVLLHESFSLKETFKNIFDIMLNGAFTDEGRNQFTKLKKRKGILK
ncbi:MAG: TetR/AcrR family transcriptional regulator [Bacteroidetes bacterium]|nr:TetR/AcrR family transcriptional regulator [Bacteroidota bacterium]